MNQSLYSGATGLYAQQRRIEVIAHNIANVNNYGFKAARTDFKDALYSTMLRAEQPQEDLNHRVGHGVLLTETPRQFTQGATFNTGMPADMMVQGEGYFTVEGPNGDPIYTRDGSFSASTDANGRLTLVTGGGMFVLDENGQRIQFPENSSVNDLVVGPDGSMRIGDAEPFAKLTLVRFANPDGLSSAGNNAYRETESSGAVEVMPAAGGSTILQGALEGSTTDLALEMSRMIRTQRALSIASRAVTASDQMEQQANTIRG